MAAGLGFKTFTTGEVLTASDVNGYLMQGVLVFASAAARNAAITSPQEGQFAYTKDTNSLWYYDGAAWVASGATGDIEGVTVSSPITGGGTSGTVNIAIQDALTTQKGSVQLSDSTSTTSSILAATPTAVKSAYDLATTANTAAGTAQTTANAAIPKSTVTTAGDVIYATGTSALTRLGIGSTGQVLTVSGGVPSWATPAGGATFSGCSLRSSVDLTTTDATTLTVNFNTETFDVDGYHDTSTNTSRITIPSGKTGYFLISYNLRFNNNATGYRNVNLLRNGSNIKSFAIQAVSSGSATSLGSTQIVYATTGDYFQVQAFQNSGGNLDLSGGTNDNQNFAITYLGA